MITMSRFFSIFVTSLISFKSKFDHFDNHSKNRKKYNQNNRKNEENTLY